MIVKAETDGAPPMQRLPSSFCTCRGGLGLVSRKNTQRQKQRANGFKAPRGTPGCKLVLPPLQPFVTRPEDQSTKTWCCLGCPEKASYCMHLPLPRSVGLHEAVDRRALVVLYSCCGAGAAVALLRASLVHMSFVLSPSRRRKPKLSKI